MQIWRLIDTGSNSGCYNMAVDEAMAIACREGAVPPTLRFYRWDPPCISIGYFQKVERLSDMQDHGRKDTPIVRRITGGRAVFHGDDVSYSIVCDTASRLFPGNIRESYLVIAEAFVAGLRHLGITADPVNIPKKTPYARSTLCFSTALGHEITVMRRKLIGSAQRRWPDIFLQHGSILITGDSSHNGINSICLEEILKDKPDINTLISSLCKGVRESLGVHLIEGELTGYEKGLAEDLLKNKYSRDSWNIRKT